MSAEELSAGADWLRREFYRPARIVRRVIEAALRLGPMPAWLSMRLNLTYRRDNLHEGIIGWNPAYRAHSELPGTATFLPLRQRKMHSPL